MIRKPNPFRAERVIDLDTGEEITPALQCDPEEGWVDVIAREPGRNGSLLSRTQVVVDGEPVGLKERGFLVVRLRRRRITLVPEAAE